MRKIMLLCAVLSILISCRDEVNDSTPEVRKKPMSNGPVLFSPKGKAPQENARPSFPTPPPPFTPQDLYVGVTYGTVAISASTGMGYYVDNDALPNHIAMASSGGMIYSVRETWNSVPNLVRLNPTSGARTILGTQWSNTDAMTAWGSWLYVIQGGTLWRVNASTGATTPFSQYPYGWQGTEAMTALDGNLYAIHGGTLWRVNISSGAVSEFSQYPQGWQGTEAMAATNGGIFIVQGGTLWRVGTNGTVAPYSQYPNGWAGTLAMTGRNGIVYVIQGTTLWQVNTFNQGVSQLGTANWGGTTAMTPRW